MPCSYKIYKDRRLVASLAFGEFTFAEGMAHEDRLYSDPDFDPTFDHLVDATPLTKADLSASELASLARRRMFAPMSRKAIVVNSTFFYGLARMYEAYLQLSGSAESTGIFKEMTKAREWLGIDFEL